jgi:hypothetical protein
MKIAYTLFRRWSLFNRFLGNRLLSFDIYEREELPRQKWFPYLSGKLLLLTSTGEPRRCYTSESTSMHANSPFLSGMTPEMWSRLGKSRRVQRRSRSSLRSIRGKRLRSVESFIAMMEVCGFNDWLIPS